MITLEEWVMIKHMHRQGVPKARIAREMGLDPRTVGRAINSDEHPERKKTSIDFSQKNSDFEWDILGCYNNMNITSHKYNIIRGDTHEPAYARFPSN